MSDPGGVTIGRHLVDGRELGYRRAGHGPPVLLLHDAFGDSRQWQPQLVDLSDEFTVVAWDAPGCGGSFDPPETFTLADFADQAAALVRGLGLGRVHAVGLSFGGGLALELYRRHPALVRSLVLASADAGWTGSLPAEEVAARWRRGLAEAEHPPEQWVSDYLAGYFAGRVPAAVRDDVRSVMRDSRPAGIRAIASAFATADLRDMLGTVAVPTLLLHGEGDARTPRRVADDLHARIPGSRLVVLPGVGHVCNLEAPELFDAEVRAFLHSVPG